MVCGGWATAGSGDLRFTPRNDPRAVGRERRRRHKTPVLVGHHTRQDGQVIDVSLVLRRDEAEFRLLALGQALQEDRRRHRRVHGTLWVAQGGDETTANALAV